MLGGLLPILQRELVFGWEQDDAFGSKGKEPSKSTIILQLCERHGVAPNKVMFVDDEPANIRDLGTACPLVSLVPVVRPGKGEGGMSDRVD